MAKSNTADAFKTHYNMMRLTGIWPEIQPNLFYRLKCVVTWILGIGLTTTMIMEVIYDVTDFIKLSEILYILVSITIYLFKLGSFTYQKRSFLIMLDSLKNPIFVSYPDHVDHYMAKTIKLSTILANLYQSVCMCCIAMYAVYPVLDHKPLPVPFPYDVGSYRYAMYAFQIASIGSAAWNNSCLDILATSLMGIAAAQLDILMEKLVCIGEDSQDLRDQEPKLEKKVVKKLKHCVEHHLAIIKFVKNIEGVFTVGLFAQFLSSILVICNTLFHFVLLSAISSQSFMLANYFIAMVAQLSMYCWYGNEIMLKSVRVGEACYLSKWYNFGNEIRQYMFIIMERSKRPLKITALKFSNLSLATLTSILQWSYSCLTLLMKMYNKRSSK